MTESYTKSPTEVLTESEKKLLLHTKNEVARHLLDLWLSDETGYDEQTWPKVAVALEENNISIRKRLSE